MFVSTRLNINIKFKNKVFLQNICEQKRQTHEQRDILTKTNIL